MTRLSIALLGTFQVSLDGFPITDFPYTKVQALLAYLAVEANHAHRREALAEMLWPHQTEQTARTNLRQTVSKLRKTIQDHSVRPPFLLVTHETIKFNPASDHDLDVTQFVRVVGGCHQHMHQPLETCPACMENLQQAVTLYKGKFLENITVGDSEEFENWMFLRRERLHRLALDALYHLANHYLQHRDYERARQSAWQQIELEPWREEAHRQLMKVLVLSGKRSTALAQYEICRRTLAEELGVEPSEETNALYEEIRTGELAPTGPELKAATINLPPKLRNPYKGLRAFQEADVDDFFGRETMVQQLAAHLRSLGQSPRFLAVIGPSGSGKSSVIKAGLIPALRMTPPGNSGSLLIAQMRPGNHPLEELEVTLLRVASNPPTTLLSQLWEDERGLLRAIRRILPDDHSELLLVVDQLEELFTLVEDDRVRRHFINSLVAAVANPRSPFSLVVTLRADFYDRPLLYPAFGQLLHRNAEVILPLSNAELERAIVRPAESAGVQLEAGLIATIMKDFSEQPGALPLLQFALTDLFDRRDGRTLTLEAYRASGGVSSALAQRAEELYTELDEIAKAATRQVFLRLVTLGEGVEDTRRRMHRTEVETIADEYTVTHVLNTFAQHRLLTFDRDPVTNSPTVEIAHDALIREWKHLRTWVAESRDNLRVQRRLMAAATEWVNAGHDVSFLASGTRLTHFEGVAAGGTVTLNHEETAYLQASIGERERQRVQDAARAERELLLQRRSARQLRYLVGILLIFLATAVGLTAFALSSQRLALNNATRSESLRLAAEANILLQGESGNAELAALLSLRSLNTIYSPQADATSRRAIRLAYTRQIFASRSGAIRNVAFSPEGTHILTVSDALTAQLWDIQTGAMLVEFKAEPEKIASAVFSPDGKQVLTGSAILVTSGRNGTTARLWSVETGMELKRFTGHIETVRSVAFSGDGKYILTSSIYPTARLWDVQTGIELHAFTDPGGVITSGGTVNSVTFSPDGKQILTGNDNQMARVWDVQTRMATHTLSGHTAQVTSVAFSPDGKYIVAGSADHTSSLWNAQTGDLIRKFSAHASAVSGVAFSPDSKYILTGSLDKTACLWNILTGELVRIFSAHTDAITSVAFSPDGKFVLTGSADQTARLWSAQIGFEPRALNARPSQVNAVAFSPDGKYILTGEANRVARLWDAATNVALRTFSGHANQVNGVAISSDSKYILTGSRDRTARLWDAATGKELRQFSGHTNWVTSVVFSPNGNYVLTGSYDRTARLWDAATGKELRQFSGHTNWVTSVAFSPDGDYVLTGSADKTARLWQTQSGEALRTFTGHTDAITSVAFSPDGDYILTGSADKTARLWQTQSGSALRTFSGHAGGVTSVAFSPNGDHILTGSIDMTAQVWDVQSGISLRSFSDHTDQVTSVAFSPSGKLALSGSRDNSARLWDTDYHDWITLACSQVWRELTDDERSNFDIKDRTPTCASRALLHVPTTPLMLSTTQQP